MSNTQVVTSIFLCALGIKEVLEAYLEKRNTRYIYAHRNKVPERFQDVITLEEHQKAAEYARAKGQAGRWFRTMDLIILLLWTFGGGLQALTDWAQMMAPSMITQGIYFMAAFAGISTLLGIPQSLYTTFVLEEKFGFNKTTPKLFIIDMIKGLVLGALIGLPIFAGLLAIIEKLGQNWWLWGWGFLIAVQFTLLWAYPRFIAPIFNKFSALEEGEVKEKVLGLLQRTGFESNGLFVMDASIRSSHGNAYFTGFGKNKRIVFFDTLIKTLGPGEVEAVLAHELGHFKCKHIVKQLMKSVVISFIGFWALGLLFHSPDFYLGHGVKTGAPYTGLVLFSMVLSAYTFWMTPISSFVSRKYEFEADTFAAQYSDPQELIQALVKLYKENASTLTPDPMYSRWYHSHPPALVRVEFLEGLKV